MPKYVFDCQTEDCHLRFERIIKMGDHPTHPCPSCKSEAPRVLDQEGFAFAFAQPEKAAPGNTGVHKDDYPTADHIVGKDAEQRWGTYAEQAKVKQVAREKGETHALIRHQGKDYIDYEPMTDAGLTARKNLAQRAMKAMEASRDARRGR
jgi:putative FmdB family regulatory protein